jgi:hypothetical protein
VAIAWNLFRREPTTLPRCRKLAGAAYRVASLRGDDSDAHGARNTGAVEETIAVEFSWEHARACR